MTQTVSAIFECGVLKPLDPLHLSEHEEVQVTVQQLVRRQAEGSTAAEIADPLRGLATSTGVPDLAEHFDDYRLGRRQP